MKKLLTICVFMAAVYTANAQNKTFCNELNFILDAMNQNDLGKIIDYNKPLGFTHLWHSSKVSLSDFTSLQCQDLFGNLRFYGIKENASKINYNDLLKTVKGCVNGF